MAQKKLPSMQFYPGDWMKDPALRSVSLAARGLWIDMLCLMHESPRRGYLQHANGKPVTTEQIARMTGCSAEEVSQLLQELEYSGVFSCSEHGVIYSRRMVREEHIRQTRSKAGRLGVKSRLLKQKRNKTQANSQAKRKQNAGSSTSSSISTSVIEPPNGGTGKRAPPLAASSAEPTATSLSEAMMRIEQAWHAIPQLPQIRRWSEARKKHLRARIRDPAWLDEAIRAIEQITQYPFLVGANDRGWVATIDWLLRPDSVTKILEGQYGSTNGAKANTNQHDNQARYRYAPDRPVEAL